MKRLAFLLAPVLMAAACDTPQAPTQASESAPPPAFDVTTETTDYMLHVTGYALWANADVIINAARLKNGEFRGETLAPKGLRGVVVGLVPPDGTIDHWCINVLVLNEPRLEGYNVLFYLRDIGDGNTSFDELATEGGFGVTCADLPTPVNTFEAVESGNYKTRIKAF